MKEREMVRAGYDAIAHRYLGARTKASDDVRLLGELGARLSRGSRILDAGCGAGVPVTMSLADRFGVVGLDSAGQQLRLARRNVPGAHFAQGDLAALPFADASFEAAVCYYAIIHVPRAEHPRVLAAFQRVLRPGGLLLICMGAGDLPESVEEFHGQPMYWSHFDAATNLAMLRSSGFEVLWERLVDDATYPGSAHLFVLARRP